MGPQNKGARQADPETVANSDAIGFQLTHFLEQRLRRQDDAVANQTVNMLTQDTGRDQMKRRSPAVNHQGMAGIVSALEANNGRDLVGQQINNLTLAFITPLGAQHNNVFTHDSLSMRLPRRTGVSQVYL